MADKVLFQTDDALSETNLAARRARDNSTDYVERGLAVTPDWANGKFDVSAGHAVLKKNVKAYDVFADPRSGLSLADSSGTNYVFLVVDPSNRNDVTIEVNADGSAPGSPSLLIQKLDAAAKTSSAVNRRPSASYDSISGVADTFVTSTSELESAFANLSAGETLRIAQPDTPYRPGQWLDIDANYVTVLAESQFARDGQPLIKPADGSNVGGVRVGHDSATKHVRVEGLGFHGNSGNMSGTAKRLHAFVADQNASHVTFRDNYATQTHPYHELNSGGSGFTVRKNAANVELVGNRVDDIGDRGIQAAGTNLLVRGNVLTNGYGDSISLNVTEPDDDSYIAKNASVVNNFGRDNAKGSIVAFGKSASRNTTPRSERGYFAVVGNVGAGQHRKLIQFGRNAVNVKAVSAIGNVGDGRNADHFGIRSAVRSEDSWVNISNNILLGYNYGGVRVTKGHNVNVSNNLIAGVGGEGIVTSGYSNHKVTGNIVRNAGTVGVKMVNQMAPATVAQNQIRFCQEQGIVVNQGGTASDRGVTVYGNSLDANNQGSNGVPELDVQTQNVLAFGNHVATRGGSASFSDAGSGNLWVGNMAPADGSAWSLGSATGVRTMANRPNPAGEGFVVTTPDGTAEYEITVDNNGSVTTTQL
ncbi:right-handed parallel beta-helix repeat-containing protein [Halorussus caseinilyticus]|uniref:Right-handed parallel beta-helix repeat-containing protein n=1 Tax=Halorussus caseinilyticus TaxID=3034025 RepID=A0ABD5WN58_9EURY|nr:right-handed parallel beta-helix repeat-containing protein [Halorussus sp. DT72]